MAQSRRLRYFQRLDHRRIVNANARAFAMTAEGGALIDKMALTIAGNQSEAAEDGLAEVKRSTFEDLSLRNPHLPRDRMEESTQDFADAVRNQNS